jgi:aspartyl-tRNA(Asn)/glutamyl-tRNA(Gln) amidotransferase subunit B
MSDGTISGKIAKDLLDIVWSEGGDPAEVVRARGLVQMTDTGAIEAAIEAVIASHPDKVEEIKKKPKLAGWFVGQVMKQTGGKANPQVVNALLKTRLELPDEG